MIIKNNIVYQLAIFLFETRIFVHNTLKKNHLIEATTNPTISHYENSRVMIAQWSAISIDIERNCDFIFLIVW